MTVPATPATLRPRLLHRVAIAVFLLGFLVPVLARSVWPKAKWGACPRTLVELQSVACLFSIKPAVWNSYYVQVRRGNAGTWETLDQRELFPLEPFGRRTRMHRLLAAWDAKPSRKTKDMARWILLADQKIHPERQGVTELRFARVSTIPNRDDPPQGRWEHPRWESVPPQRRGIIVSYLAAELLGDAP